MYAGCTKCGIKSCIFYHRPKEEDEDENGKEPKATFMLTQRPTPKMSYEVRLQPGLVIVDTGCRRAVRGTQCHAQLQKELDEKGMQYEFEFSSELYQFGPDRPIPSMRRWKNPVGPWALTERMDI